MDAVDYELDAKKGIVIIYVCRRCKERTRNMSAHEDGTMADDYAGILALKSLK